MNLLYAGIALIAIAIMFLINADKKKKALSTTEPNLAKRNFNKALACSTAVVLIGLGCMGVWVYKAGYNITKATQTINTSGVSSNVTIQVPDLINTDVIGSKKAQGTYKILHIKVTNGQKDAIYVNCANFVLLDDQDREFSYSSDINTLPSGDVILCDTLNPGLTFEGYIVYDIPKDAKGLSLRCRGGMLGEDIYLKLK